MVSRQTPYQAAVEYINMGLAVFPVVYKGKTPLTKNGCKDATTDAAVVKGWWQKWPNANIGIATGAKSNGLLVIDLDVDDNRGIDGYQTLRDWEKKHGHLPETIQSITGGGGYHLLYRGAQRVGNRAKVLEGIDVRGEGGISLRHRLSIPMACPTNGNKAQMSTPLRRPMSWSIS